MNSSDSQLSDAVSTFKIGPRTWKIGHKLKCQGLLAVKKSKMQEIFKDDWNTAVLEGEIVGCTDLDEIKVKWNGIDNPPFFLYRTNSFLFKDMLESRPPKRPKNGTSSFPAGGVSRMNSRNALQVDPNPSTNDVNDENPQESNNSGEVIGNIVEVRDYQWKQMVGLDGLDCSVGIPHYDKDALLKWPQRLSADRPRTELDYWKLMIGDNILKQLIDMSKSASDEEEFILNEKNIQKFIGVMYAMTVCPQSNIKDYWNLEERGFIQAPSFTQKTGMSYNQFKQIRKQLIFGQPSESDKKSFDRVRPLFDSFNQQRQKILVPGSEIVMDESTIEWNGKDSHMPSGPPHLTHMKNKPVTSFFMVKNSADVQTGMLYRVELQEGRILMQGKEFTGSGVMATTAIIKRLAQPLFGSGRTIYYDGWFTSLPSAFELWDHGLFSVGILKTAHAGTPKQYLIENSFDENSARGDTKVLHLTHKDRRYIALAWNEPGFKNGKQVLPPKIFLGNIHSAVAAAPWERPREIEGPDGEPMQTTLSIPQPLIVERYYNAANTIDMANQLRQGLVQIERVWKTKSWERRIFQSVMGMHAIDAKLAFEYETGLSMTVQEFMNNLAMQMISDADAGKDEVVVTTPMKLRDRVMIEVEEPPTVSKKLPEHSLAKCSRYGLGGVAGHGKCRECKTITTYFCETCTNMTLSFFGKQKSVCYLCLPTETLKRGYKPCYQKHLASMSNA